MGYLYASASRYGNIWYGQGLKENVFDWTYKLASTEPHKDPRWVYWVAGVCGFLLVALVILLVIMPYFLWRKRVILVMKLVHYFQGYEDDDDSKWDAFISYKSNTPDEDFVVHTLFPKLARELGFSVNVHFKDFTPGEDITNNIIHAVENSRRTILIVSPNYLASNFAKFEWQTAQQRMLERRHRIIPILLEDVSSYRESMDPNLRQILDSVTYIEWPHDENTTQKKTDKFWKRIELSMPKKKQKSTASPNEYSKDTPTDNTTATFVKPDSVELTVVNGEEISRPPYLHEDSGIYCSINENERPNPEEVYNTINEADIEAKSQGKEHTKNNSNDAYYITPKHTQIAESSNNLENQLTKENLDEREMKFLKILEVDV
ncbi:toll-like receptor Tollo isoform X3 [Mya arenaria]|uniref:toll-like receptor Tollo isoform X3 n=1 Tax=Mya arenaria TaxID=6604 RepID=UPI0022E78E82|nr:toll-like receptor Tollo isoform X3 [Mya arenaria]